MPFGIPTGMTGQMGGGGGGGGGGFGQGLLDLLKQTEFSYRGSGGGGFNFGPSQGRERQQLLEQLMRILQGPRQRKVRMPDSPVVYPGRPDQRDAESPMQALGGAMQGNTLGGMMSGNTLIGSLLGGGRSGARGGLNLERFF